MHRGNILRIFLLVFAVFILTFTAFNSIWYETPHFVSMNSPRDYNFASRNTGVIHSAINNYVSFTTYGEGITVNAFFNASSTSTNETTTGYIFIMKSSSPEILNALYEVKVNGSIGTVNRHFVIPPGHYIVETFIDYSYLGVNYTTEQQVLATHPGENGTVVVHLAFPSLLSHIVIGSGILSAIMLAFAVFKRNCTYISGDLESSESWLKD